MSIFSNVHRLASSVIPRRKIKYRKSKGAVINQFGVRTASYDEWTETIAHVQPGVIAAFGGKCVSERDYKDFGLDFSKMTMTVWLDDKDLSLMVHKDFPDQLMIDGKIFNIMQVSDWLEFSGWKRIFCEEAIDE